LSKSSKDAFTESSSADVAEDGHKRMGRQSKCKFIAITAIERQYMICIILFNMMYYFNTLEFKI
jgi:hypothetical protein